ncbi:MAG: HAD family hydrolase [Bacillota bacterium]|jgi:putative hydrolase of the HAD superfamily
MDSIIKAIVFDLDDTLLEDEQNNKDAFFITCKLAQKKYKNIDIKKLYSSVEYQAEKLWSQYHLFKYLDNIQVSFWEGLCAGFHCNNQYFRQIRLWLPEYRHHTWSHALSAQNIFDLDLAKKLSENFILERTSRFNPFPEVITVLEKLSQRKQLAILTNGDPYLQWTKISNSGLNRYFDTVIISGTLGVGKPEPDIFLHTIKKLNLLPNNILMVGDNLERDVLGANKVGIKSVWINRKKKTNHTAVSPDLEISSLMDLL